MIQELRGEAGESGGEEVEEGPYRKGWTIQTRSWIESGKGRGEDG